MSANPAIRYVEARCVGTPPATRIARACGVSDVVIDGHIVRCTVTGSMQPFLEALRGAEILDLLTFTDPPPGAHDAAPRERTDGKESP